MALEALAEGDGEKRSGGETKGQVYLEYPTPGDVIRYQSPYGRTDHRRDSPYRSEEPLNASPALELEDITHDGDSRRLNRPRPEAL